MFNEKNLLYYSSNKELGRPEAESEEDFVGELHTATSVIAQVEDEDEAKEIVEVVNMQKDWIASAKGSRFLLMGFRDHWVKQQDLFKGEERQACIDNARTVTNQIEEIEKLIKKAEKK
jgi:hypothetical protein